MTLRNRIYNWWYGIKRYRGKGCRNCGLRGDCIVKYDWSRPIVYQSRRYDIKDFKIPSRKGWYLSEIPNYTQILSLNVKYDKKGKLVKVGRTKIV